MIKHYGDNVEFYQFLLVNVNWSKVDVKCRIMSHSKKKKKSHILKKKKMSPCLSLAAKSSISVLDWGKKEKLRQSWK